MQSFSYVIESSLIQRRLNCNFSFYYRHISRVFVWIQFIAATFTIDFVDFSELISSVLSVLVQVIKWI